MTVLDLLISKGTVKPYEKCTVRERENPCINDCDEDDECQCPRIMTEVLNAD